MSDQKDEHTKRVEKDQIESEHERLMRAASKKAAEKAQQHNATTRLDKADADLLATYKGAFGLRVGDAVSYQVLPKSFEAEAQSNPSLLRWRIELAGMGTIKNVLGLDICGDVVLGRCLDKEDDPDLDLTPFEAAAAGVSRRHAILRPSASKLYLIDLGSTNGTRVNTVPVTGARALAHLDTLSFGNLIFQLKIVDSRSVDS
jgi:hypothetical protein